MRDSISTSDCPRRRVLPGARPMSWGLFGLCKSPQSRSPNRFRPAVEELETRLAPANNTIAWNGGNWFLSGVNYPWKNYGADFNNGPPLSAIASDFATL